ncbi:MAG: hypothetical protein HY327_11540 [Chloroflexi bacterium]|nr:hypothetical protein [Chloroflexota bacterium]
MNQTIGRFSGVFVIALLVAVLMLASGNSVWAAPPGQGGTVPPPGSGTGPVGTGGVTIGGPANSSVTFPPNSGVPNGSTLTIFPITGGSIPATGGFRGPGGHVVGITLLGPNGLPITQFSTNITICFTLTAAEVATAGGAGNVKLEWFNSATGKWEAQTTTALPGNQFCISVNHLSIFGVFTNVAETQAESAVTESSNWTSLLPLAFGIAGALALGFAWTRRPKK